jgi:hypothetical protein
MRWLDRRRRARELRRRRRVVANWSGTSDPVHVSHALDYFIWSALEDQRLRPREPRPFGPDERRYNAILNRHFRIEESSTAEETEARLGRREDEDFYVPYYFPDEPLNVMTGVAKHGFVMLRWEAQHRKLVTVTGNGGDEFARPLEAVPALPSGELLVSPSAYPAYYNRLLEGGHLFSRATPAERERACIAAMKAAVIAPGDVAEIRSPEGWYAVNLEMARMVIADFLDPEALLP